MRYTAVALLVGLVCTLGAALAGCSLLGIEKKQAATPATPAPSGEKIIITQATWAAFVNYRYWLTPIAWTKPMGQGFFAVAKDGRTWGLTGCTANVCVAGKPDSQAAINACQDRSAGVPCLVFAKDQSIVVPYEVAD